MKTVRLFGVAALALPALLAAQQPAASSANPVTDAARQVSSRFARFLNAAAEQVPADKLSYKPTDGQRTFGEIWAHLTQANNGICAGIGGMEAPKSAAGDAPQSKEALVAALKASFEFCDRAFANTDDSKLGEQVSMGFMNGTRALAMFIFVDDLADHYSQVANYMRLNGMLPPSAQRRGGN